MTCLVVKVPSSSFQKSKLVTPQPPSAARCETGKYSLFQRLLSALFCLLAFTLQLSHWMSFWFERPPASLFRQRGPPSSKSC